MIPIMMLEFTKRTREDWQAFDDARRIAFEPTPEEIEARETQYLTSLLLTAKQYLSKY